MTSAEYTQWLAYDQVEPIGTARDDIHIAMQIQALANIHRNPKKRSPYKMKDFHLGQMITPRQQSPEEAKSALIRLALSHGAKVTNG